MSVNQKWEIIMKIKAMVDGIVGVWANDVNEMVICLENNILNDELFHCKLVEWEKKLLPQAPAMVWQSYIRG